MPPPLWSGSLSFGLVNVPVTLQSAVRDRSIRFHLLHEPDLSPVRTRRVCTQEGVEVPPEEILKGYELDDGTLVLLTDEELEAAAPRRSRAIEIERFVADADVDPLHYERSYLVAPRGEGAVRAYLLLAETMRESGRVALGRFVMRARERLVAIRSDGDGLALSTMRFADELRGVEEIAPSGGAKRPGRLAVERAVALIEELSVDFEPEQYRDEHRAHLERIIERKRRGEEVLQPRAVEERPTVAPDLMGALEESLARVRGEGVARVRRESVTAPGGRQARHARTRSAR
ncbi:MAG: non-homologous end joining protein Ku [Solirubrobacteraceae bacterium]